eukprot:jgi/Tetstr1/449399/TSEL_036494.t1
MGTADTAMALVEDGELSQAAGRLSSKGMGDLSNHALLAQFRDKHPSNGHRIMDAAYAIPVDEAALAVDMLRVPYQQLKQRMAAGASCMRNDYLRCLLGEDRAPDARQVTVGEAERRAAERAVVDNMKEAYVVVLATSHLGVGISAGDSVLVHGVRLIAEKLGPRAVIVHTDLRNVYNEAWRPTIIQRHIDCSPLHPVIHALMTSLSKDSFLLKDDRIAPLRSEDGVQQGAPLATISFCVVQCATTRCGSTYGGAGRFSADGGYLVGLPEHVWPALLHAFRTSIKGSVGLEERFDKMHAYIADMEAARHQAPADIEWPELDSHHGIPVVNVPLGSPWNSNNTTTTTTPGFFDPQLLESVLDRGCFNATDFFRPPPVDALESAEGGFALGDLWAALDELEEDQLIEEVVEELLNDVDASNQDGEEYDHENAYAYSSSEAEDSGDDEDELYFSPLPTRNPRRDTLYGHAYFVDDAMSDDEMEPRRGKGSSGRLWAGHEKATSEHTFETWKNSTGCAMEKEQQQAFDRNRPFNEIHEVHVLRSRIQPRYLESLETTLISRGIKYEDSRIVRRLEGAERLDYYRRLLDGMWEELVNITKEIELHSERYSKCHRSPGETVRDFRNLLLTHTRVKNLVTEETTRIVEISRVNVEFLARAWGKTRFSPRINFAQQQLVDYTMDTQVDMTWEMAEWLDKQERGSIHIRAHSRVQSGGGGRGFDHEEHNNRGGGRGSDSRGRGGSHGEGGNYHRRGATNPREHIRVREEPKKPDRKSCMMCGKDAGHTTEECGKLRKFVANLKATDGHEPKHPPLNGYAQVVGSEEGEVVGLAAASQLRPQRKNTEAQRHGVNTVRMEDGEREARQRRLPRGFTTPSMEMAQQMHSRTELTAKLTSAAQSVTVPVSLANGGGQPRMSLMEIAKRLVKHEPVENGWEKHAVMRALDSKRVSISLMEAYQLERSGGGMMESIMATAWGGGALSTEPISSHAHSARTSSGERAFEAALMMVEEHAEVANKGIFALQPTGAEAKEQPETARLDTITCELHANNTLLQCETISDGGSSHTRMNASAMERSAAEAVVKGAGG